MRIFKPLLLLSFSLILFSCSKKSSSQDPIVGTWHFLRAVDYHSDSAHELVSVSEILRGELTFMANGNFSFTHSLANDPPYFYTTHGTWYKTNNTYIINYTSQFNKTNIDSVDFLNHPKVVFKNHSKIDGMELKLQSDNKVVNGVVKEYYYREYHRLY